MTIATTMRRARERGQSAVLLALILPFVVGCALLVVEVAERWLEVEMVEDALQQATRSAVQQFDYAALARGDGRLRASAACRNVTWRQDARCQAMLAVARQLFITNLAGVRGLDESPTALANRVRWTLLPAGGTCSYTSPAARAVTQTTPLLCAEVRPLMRGIVGWGQFRPLVIAADTLDPIR